MRKTTTISLLLITAICLLACEQTQFTDQRDGKTYKTTKIGEQVWLAENLNYEAEGSKCYNDSITYCDKYGRLYNWETAKKVCPNGWHSPSMAEWGFIMNFSSGETTGNNLKASNGWKPVKGIQGNGNDKFGFAALPGGYSDSGGSFFQIGYLGFWWSSSGGISNKENLAIGMYMNSKLKGADFLLGSKTALYSVRCIKNP